MLGGPSTYLVSFSGGRGARVGAGHVGERHGGVELDVHRDALPPTLLLHLHLLPVAISHGGEDERRRAVPIKRARLQRGPWAGIKYCSPPKTAAGRRQVVPFTGAPFLDRLCCVRMEGMGRAASWPVGLRHVAGTRATRGGAAACRPDAPGMQGRLGDRGGGRVGPAPQWE